MAAFTLANGWPAVSDAGPGSAIIDWGATLVRDLCPDAAAEHILTVGEASELAPVGQLTLDFSAWRASFVIRKQQRVRGSSSIVAALMISPSAEACGARSRLAHFSCKRAHWARTMAHSGMEVAAV